MFVYVVFNDVTELTYDMAFNDRIIGEGSIEEDVEGRGLHFTGVLS